MLPYTDILPATKSSKHNRLSFVASERQTGGVLTLTTDRTAEDYAVVESIANAEGRGFAVAKYEGDECYSVFCGRTVPTSCDCPGFERHGHCKHATALEKLIAEGAL